MTAIFFVDRAEFRAWLERHHDTATEVWVGFFRKGTRRTTLDYPASVEEALCFGWIDGVRKKIDEDSYTNRFTPRRPGSNWSEVNIRRVHELTARGRMAPAGLREFEARKATPAGYSFEQRGTMEFDAVMETRFRANPAAWDWWTAAPPGYRKFAIWWVLSAKREATRARRLETLIADSAAGRKVGPMRRPEE
jgi:uncharacterized protein YdeI (YjbR/CyaY-like superfamily)